MKRTNTNYQWQNGFLIDKNVSDRTSYIAIYANPNMTSAVVPTNVKILKAGLFQNNRNISSINLNNVQYIGSNCFANSSLQNVLGGANVKSAGENAFLATSWLNNQNGDFVVLGNILLGYNGNDEVVYIPDGITRICENCFKSNNIESIVLSDTHDYFPGLPAPPVLPPGLRRSRSRRFSLW